MSTNSRTQQTPELQATPIGPAPSLQPQIYESTVPLGVPSQQTFQPPYGHVNLPLNPWHPTLHTPFNYAQNVPSQPYPLLHCTHQPQETVQYPTSNTASHPHSHPPGQSGNSVYQPLRQQSFPHPLHYPPTPLIHSSLHYSPQQPMLTPLPFPQLHYTHSPSLNQLQYVQSHLSNYSHYQPTDPHSLYAHLHNQLVFNPSLLIIANLQSSLHQQQYLQHAALP